MDYKEKSEDRDTSQEAVAKVQAKLGECQMKSVVMVKKSGSWILVRIPFPQTGGAGQKLREGRRNAFQYLSFKNAAWFGFGYN